MRDKDISRNYECRTKEFNAIYKVLKNLYISSFTWTGFPSSINVDYLEKMLFENGSIAFFKDTVMNMFLCVQGTEMGVIDVYNEPTKIRVTANQYDREYRNYRNIRNKSKNVGEAIMIYDTVGRVSPKARLLDFAWRIYNCEQTSDVNIFAQRTPVFMEVERGQEVTVKNLYKQYAGYAPVIYSKKKNSMSSQPINVVKTDAPIVFDKIQEQKRKLWNEALSFIGIENNFSEKNERLVSNEVLVSNGLAIAQRQSRIDAREQALELIKELYPELDNGELSVEFSNISILDFQNKGGVNDGELYSDSE